MSLVKHSSDGPLFEYPTIYLVILLFLEDSFLDFTYHSNLFILYVPYEKALAYIYFFPFYYFFASSVFLGEHHTPFARTRRVAATITRQTLQSELVELP
ncbi:hypothetical protein F4809DRAFT_405289 [Biscogniauxia mediterranea]|nr:hypothetical protein F4809DRAFT_405289 [Biscogniauxia mediterranea]